MAKEKTSKIKGFSQRLYRTKDLVFGTNYKELLDKYYLHAQIFYKDVKFKLYDLSNTNYELGIYHYNQGNLSDARFRFWFYSVFWHDHAEVDYFLGRLYFEVGNFNKAIVAFEKYIASGNTTYAYEVTYSLKAAKGEIADIHEIPIKILQHNYDALAGKYNDIYLKEPELSPQYTLCNALVSYLNEIGKPFGNRLLDLGCGTGIMGKTLKEFKVAGHVTGVDISPKMSEIAVTLKIDNMVVYNQVLNISIEDFFAASTNKNFDLVVASYTLLSFSDTGKFLMQVTETCAANAVLGLLFKTHEGMENCIFNAPTEEFLHSATAVNANLKQLGWKIISEENIEFFDASKGKYIICTR